MAWPAGAWSFLQPQLCTNVGEAVFLQARDMIEDDYCQRYSVRAEVQNHTEREREGERESRGDRLLVLPGSIRGLPDTAGETGLATGAA